MGNIIRLHDLQHVHDMIRQEPILATLRRPRAGLLGDRNARIAQYREKAEELRTISEDVILEETRSTLLRLADSYEQLAFSLEGVGAAAPDGIAAN